jgi:hypothetical protein
MLPTYVTLKTLHPGGIVTRIFSYRGRNNATAPGHQGNKEFMYLQ